MSLTLTTSRRSIVSPPAIFFCALLLSACSSSDNSQSTDFNDSAVLDDTTIPANGDSSAVVDDSTDNLSNNTASNSVGEIAADNTNGNPEATTVQLPPVPSDETTISGAESDSMAPGPLEPASTTEASSLPDEGDLSELEPLLTRVSFDITVPVYVSNSLQVQLTWGDKELSANWVIDETWNVSDEFLSDTENLLNVNFLDRNGAILLGSYETVYRTGTGSFESITIGADQFDTARWDLDNDGVSNLNELLVGADPLTAPDPSTQNLIRVDFGITVPAYMSSALQVRLVWGDEEIDAIWAGDESWSAYADLPADTEEHLIVTYYDRDGALPIGRYETTYQTGNNSSEYFQIESRQINTNRFDNDIDGVSNYSELLAETDPDVSDSSVPVTFTSVKERFTRCGGCHSSYRSLATLHDVLLSQVTRDDKNMVVPFEPENSFLVNKLEGSMRQFARPGFAELVRAWITKGALDN